MKPVGRSPEQLTLTDRTMVEEYLTTNKSLDEIAKKYRIPYSTLRYKINKYNEEQIRYEKRNRLQIGMVFLFSEDKKQVLLRTKVGHPESIRPCPNGPDDPLNWTEVPCTYCWDNCEERYCGIYTNYYVDYSEMAVHLGGSSESRFLEGSIIDIVKSYTDVDITYVSREKMKWNDKFSTNKMLWVMDTFDRGGNVLHIYTSIICKDDVVLSEYISEHMEWVDADNIDYVLSQKPLVIPDCPPYTDDTSIALYVAMAKTVLDIRM